MHDQIHTERYLTLSGIHDFVQQVARYDSLSAKTRSDNARQDRSHPRVNNAMGNAFADALRNWKK